MKTIAIYIVLILALMTIGDLIKEKQTIYLDEDGMAYVSRSSWSGFYEKYYQAKVINGKWEIRKLYEKTPFGKKEIKDKFKPILFETASFDE